MDEKRAPNLVTSGLSKPLTVEGITLQINIIRLEGEGDWSLEVVTPDGASTVWNDVFPTDDAAYSEFERTLAREGVKAFLDQSNIIPFRR